MVPATANLPIVVGVDGSKHALRAVIWAVDEAVSRDSPLLLICVVDPDLPELDGEYAFARKALHKAWSTAEATGKPVKLECNVLDGDPVTELVELSRSAEMVCVGSRGANDSKRHERGSTAAELAKAAFAPVAIVRRRHPRKPPTAGKKWVVAALESSSGSHTVLQTAFEEAVLREAPILALTPWSTAESPKSKDRETIRAKLDRYLEQAHDDDVEVHISTLPISDHISDLVKQSADIDQLIIVGPDNPDFVAEVVAPKMRKLLRHTDCSILILHNRPA